MMERYNSPVEKKEVLAIIIVLILKFKKSACKLIFWAKYQLSFAYCQ